MSLGSQTGQVGLGCVIGIQGIKCNVERCEFLLVLIDFLLCTCRGNAGRSLALQERRDSIRCVTCREERLISSDSKEAGKLKVVKSILLKRHIIARSNEIECVRNENFV